MAKSEVSRIAQLAESRTMAKRPTTWLDRLTPEQQSEIRQLRAMFQDGKIKATAVDIAKTLIDEWSLKVSTQRIRAWLKGSGDGQSP